MGDPLTVLREFVSTGRPWTEAGDEFVFGDLRFKKDAETAWNARARPGRYKLVELAMLAQHAAGITHSQYLKLMAGTYKQSTFVGWQDFKEVLQYLRGEVPTSSQVSFRSMDLRLCEKESGSSWMNA